MTATTHAYITSPCCGACDVEVRIEVQWESKDHNTFELFYPNGKSIEWKMLTEGDQERINEAVWDSWGEAVANEQEYQNDQRSDR